MEPRWSSSMRTKHRVFLQIPNEKLTSRKCGNSTFLTPPKLENITDFGYTKNSPFSGGASGLHKEGFEPGAFQPKHLTVCGTSVESVLFSFEPEILAIKNTHIPYPLFLLGLLWILAGHQILYHPVNKTNILVMCLNETVSSDQFIV